MVKRVFSGKGPEILYCLNKEKQVSIAQRFSPKSHMLFLFNKCFNSNPHQIINGSQLIHQKYSHKLAMLKELPQAHQRIEWLSKRPSIQPLGIEDLHIDVFNSEHQLEIQGK